MFKRKRRAAIVLSSLLAAIAVATGAGQAFARDSVPGQLVVGFDSGLSSRQERTAVNAAGGTIEERVDSIDGALVAVDPEEAHDVAARLARRDTVRFVEPNFVVRAARLPNDKRFGAQWALRDVRAPAAWDVAIGGPVTVAVLDTGLAFDHPDLTSNVWTNAAEQPDGADEDSDGFADDVHGADFLGQDGGADDDDGHGTHVAGIIGAQGNNSIGVTGVSWDVRIMALKFLNSSGDGSTADAARAIDYAVDHGARVINASWSGPEFSQALYSATKRAAAQGVLLVAAAGNEGSNADVTPEYPAAFDLPNVIAVGASDRSDRLAQFSNYGQRSVDLLAPGEDVESTVPSGVDPSGYAAFSGTSMAAPFVSGAAALYRSHAPWATAADVRAAILSSVDRSARLSRTTASGGKLDVAAMLSANDSPDMSAPSPFALRQPSDRRASRKRMLHFRWRRSHDDGGIREYRLYVDGRRVRTIRDRDGAGGRDPKPRTSLRLRAGLHRWFVRAVDYGGNVRRSYSLRRHKNVRSSLLYVATRPRTDSRTTRRAGGSSPAHARRSPS